MGARRPVGRPSCAPGGPSGGRLARQEARREAVLGARRPVGGRLGRQEARRQAVWAARSPESSVLPTVPAKSSVLRSRQAGRRRQAGCPRLPKLPRRHPELDNFCIDIRPRAPGFRDRPLRGRRSPRRSPTAMEAVKIDIIETKFLALYPPSHPPPHQPPRQLRGGGLFLTSETKKNQGSRDDPPPQPDRTETKIKQYVVAE